jgi:hypothetical protein
MSWSFHFIGRAVDVNAAIHSQSNRLKNDKQSSEEFEAAKPHIIALLELNQSEAATSGTGPDAFIISVRANGSAWKENGKVKQSSVNIEIKRPDGTPV